MNEIIIGVLVVVYIAVLIHFGGKIIKKDMVRRRKK